MRLLSLLITLLVVAYLIYTQLGGGSTAAEQTSIRQAEQKAAAVNDQVQEQFARQAAQISRDTAERTGEP